MISIFFLGLMLTVIACKGMYDTVRDKVETATLKDTQLLIGYDKKEWVKWPIIIDMEKTPHLFVCGLSGSGKTCLVEYAMKNKNVILVNAFKKDFRSIKARRINGNDKILKYLNGILDKIYYRNKPLYIVLDELLVLCIDSKITRAIMDLLAVGRHYNIYLIGISQIGTKETVKFKDLFNTRICFRQVEESSYRAVLGYSPDQKDLHKRQFLFYSDQIGSGYTYDVG
jgi:DNA segregation ATPase FtsK/SpoIIIE-like protein